MQTHRSEDIAPELRSMETATLYNMVTLTPCQNEPNTIIPSCQYDLPDAPPLPLSEPPHRVNITRMNP